jgi:hypothetical protein
MTGTVLIVIPANAKPRAEMADSKDARHSGRNEAKIRNPGI